MLPSLSVNWDSPWAPIRHPKSPGSSDVCDAGGTGVVPMVWAEAQRQLSATTAQDIKGRMALGSFIMYKNVNPSAPSGLGDQRAKRIAPQYHNSVKSSQPFNRPLNLAAYPAHLLP